MEIIWGILLIALLFVIFSGSKKGPSEVKRQKASTKVTGGKGSYSLQDWEDGLKLLWSGKTEPYTINYKDSKGKKSLRSVSIREIFRAENNELYVRGWDSLDRDIRTFKVSRIQGKVVNESTGELINLKLSIEKTIK